MPRLFLITCQSFWFSALAVIMVMNIVLLLRILKSDYRQCPKKPLEQEHTKAR